MSAQEEKDFFSKNSSVFCAVCEVPFFITGRVVKGKEKWQRTRLSMNRNQRSERKRDEKVESNRNIEECH